MLTFRNNARAANYLINMKPLKFNNMHAKINPTLEKKIPSPLFYTAEQAKIIIDRNDADVKVVECTIGGKGDPVLEYHEKHIPRAILFDHRLIRDQKTSIPLMMPAAGDLINHLKLLKIKKSDHLILYDRFGSRDSCRVYWMLRCQGYTNMKILNGGFKKWEAAGYPMEKCQESTAEDYKY